MTEHHPHVYVYVYAYVYACTSKSRIPTESGGDVCDDDCEGKGTGIMRVVLSDGGIIVVVPVMVVVLD